MLKYIRESLHILSISLLTFIFPNLVLGSSTSYQQLIEQKISRMTLEQKVGQLFIIGFPQKNVSPDLEKFISFYKPGSFLLFKRNLGSLEQIRALNSGLYRSSFKHTQLPPLIAIDQEGGSVSRLPITPAPPNALALGQTQSPLLAREMGFQMGRFLRDVGFNMNLAPVLDIVNPLNPSFIGVRSFGENPDVVGEMGVAYSLGLLQARVIPTAKHFPGTGSSSQDPHVKVVQNSSSLESLKELDLKPFKLYAEIGDSIAVMLSHLIYPALDSSREPASFSKKISTDLLRTEMKYKGLVITDDLQMQGSRQILRPEAAALKALQSGADIVMLTWSFADQGKAFDYVKMAVHKGELSEQEIDDKLRRILSVKAFANLFRKDKMLPSLAQGKVLTSQDYTNLESKILDANLKENLQSFASPLDRNKKTRTPSSAKHLCLFSPTKKFIDSFKAESKKPVYTNLVSGSSSKESVLSWIREKRCSLILAATTGPQTAGLFLRLPVDIKKKMILINLGSPQLIGKNSGHLRVIQLYFNHTGSGKKIAQHLQELLRDINYQLALK